eukprot:1392713-Lingulodinium_polyedra.AAC.1
MRHPAPRLRLRAIVARGVAPRVCQRGPSPATRPARACVASEDVPVPPELVGTCRRWPRRDGD